MSMSLRGQAATHFAQRRALVPVHHGHPVGVHVDGVEGAGPLAASQARGSPSAQALSPAEQHGGGLAVRHALVRRSSSRGPAAPALAGHEGHRLCLRSHGDADDLGDCLGASACPPARQPLASAFRPTTRLGEAQAAGEAAGAAVGARAGAPRTLLDLRVHVHRRSLVEEAPAASRKRRRAGPRARIGDDDHEDAHSPNNPLKPRKASDMRLAVMKAIGYPWKDFGTRARASIRSRMAGEHHDGDEVAGRPRRGCRPGS